MHVSSTDAVKEEKDNMQTERVTMREVDFGVLQGILMDNSDLLESCFENNKGSLDGWFAWEEHSGVSTAPMARTLLQLAASMQAVKCVNVLLRHGLDPNAQSPSDGKTALHLACDCKPTLASARVVALLVQHGADRALTDFKGCTPGQVVQGKVEPCCKNKMNLSSIEEPQGYLTPIERLQQIDGCDYDSDEFRMYQFKIQACPHLGIPHDTAECPYLHPGERARRRDPRVYVYKPLPCPHFRKGNCKWGDACPLAHGVFECWLHPAKYRTELCKEGAKCTRQICFFAHSMHQLRDPVVPSHSTDTSCGSNSHGLALPQIQCQHEESPTCTLVDLPASSGNGSGYSTPGLHNAGEVTSFMSHAGTDQKIAALTEVAAEKARAKQASAVAEAIEALKALAMGRYSDSHVSIGQVATENLIRNSETSSIFHMPNSSSTTSLGSNGGFTDRNFLDCSNDW